MNASTTGGSLVTPHDIHITIVSAALKLGSEQQYIRDSQKRIGVAFGPQFAYKYLDRRY